MQVRRVLAVSAAGVVALGLLSWSARAGDTPPAAPTPAASVEVEVVMADGSKVGGRHAGKSLRLRTDFGVVEIDLPKLKRLDLSPPEPPEPGAMANVLLTDKSHLTGLLLAETLALEGLDGQAVSVKLADASQVKFLHPKDASFVGLAVALLTLTVMEIVLGVDNVIFLAILAGKLPEEQRPRARKFGLAAALGTRLLLLLGLSTLMGLTRPVFTLPALPFLDTPEARGISWRDIVLLAGGLFLIAKSVYEMHEKVENAKAGEQPVSKSSFVKVIVMIAIVDIVFSLDSVITAVGMVEDVWVMVAGMVLAMLVMLGFAGPISRFVDKHPTIKMLALSFLVLIGVLLVAEGLGQHINKGYIYFAMAFAVAVELVNMNLRGKPEVKTV